MFVCWVHFLTRGSFCKNVCGMAPGLEDTSRGLEVCRAQDTVRSYGSASGCVSEAVSGASPWAGRPPAASWRAQWGEWQEGGQTWPVGTSGRAEEDETEKSEDRGAPLRLKRCRRWITMSHNSFSRNASWTRSFGLKNKTSSLIWNVGIEAKHKLDTFICRKYNLSH